MVLSWRLCCVLFVLSASSLSAFAALAPLQMKENIVFIGDEATVAYAKVLKSEYKEDLSAKKSKFTAIKHKKGTWVSLPEQLEKDLKKGKIGSEGGRVIIALGMYDACDVRKETGPVTTEADLVAAIESVAAVCLERQLQVVLCTPALLDSTPEISGYIDAVAKVIREQAAQHGFACADVRTALTKCVKEGTLEAGALVKKGNILTDEAVVVCASAIDPHLGIVPGGLEKPVMNEDKVTFIITISGWSDWINELDNEVKGYVGDSFRCSSYRLRMEKLLTLKKETITKRDEAIKLVLKQKPTIVFVVCGGAITGKPDISIPAYESLVNSLITLIKPTVKELVLITAPPTRCGSKSTDIVFSQKLALITKAIGKKRRVPVFDFNKVCIDRVRVEGEDSLIIGGAPALREKKTLLPMFLSLMGIDPSMKKVSDVTEAKNGKREKEESTVQEKGKPSSGTKAEPPKDDGADKFDLEDLDNL